MAMPLPIAWKYQELEKVLQPVADTVINYLEEEKRINSMSLEEVNDKFIAITSNSTSTSTSRNTSSTSSDCGCSNEATSSSTEGEQIELPW